MKVGRLFGQAFIALVVLLALFSAGRMAEAAEINAPVDVTAGTPTVFSANVSDMEPGAYTFVWTFDHGNATYGQKVSYVFDEMGVHNVTLSVYDVNGSLVDETYMDVDVKPDQSGMFLAVLGAGIAVGVSGMGAGIGVGIAGAAAAGALADKPNKFSKFFLFQALPQTQAIYGLLVAILIFMNTGVLGGGPVEIPFAAGLLYIGAGLAVGVAGLSAIGQGIAAGAGIGAYAENDEMFTRGVIFSVLPETQAIYGLLIAVLIIFFISDPGEFGRRPDATGLGLIAVGAGLSVGVAGLSAIGQGIASSSSIGAVAEKKEVFSRGMLFSVLPETQAIYGLLVAILLLFLSGLTSGAGVVENAYGKGLVAIGAGMAIGIAGLSAIGQGMSAGAGISSYTRNPETLMKSLLFSAMSETFAIFGLLIAILAMLAAGLL